MDAALGNGDALIAAVDLAVGQPQRQHQIEGGGGVRLGPELGPDPLQGDVYGQGVDRVALEPEPGQLRESGEKAIRQCR